MVQLQRWSRYKGGLETYKYKCILLFVDYCLCWLYCGAPLQKFVETFGTIMERSDRVGRVGMLGPFILSAFPDSDGTHVQA